MAEESKSINRCPYYRDSERGSMGMGLGFCDLDGFHTICDGDVGFCEKPDQLKTQLNKRKKLNGSNTENHQLLERLDVMDQNLASYDVLIIDDDPQIRSLLVNILSSKGQSCEQASNGSEALKKLEEKGFDVIISDIVMPGMDGITLMGEIFKKYPDLPVMIMTGHSHEYSAEMAIRSGAREFIKKPFTISEFLLRFTKMMREHEMFKVIKGKIKESEQYAEKLKKEIEHLREKLKLAS